MQLKEPPHLGLYRPKGISIPKGAVKSLKLAIQELHEKGFQFQKVQLKERFDFGRIMPHHIFQFQKVQLKESFKK